MKHILLIAACLWPLILHAEKNALISMTPSSFEDFTIADRVCGGFVEPLLDYVNGRNGFWAQEFLNRGFDAPAPGNPALPDKWRLIHPLYPADAAVTAGGYNENGIFAVRLKSEGEPRGVFQNILYVDTTGLGVYVYARAVTGTGTLSVNILDAVSGEPLHTFAIEGLTGEWEKYSFSTPRFPGYSSLGISFVFEGEGAVEIDEASCMPDNNVGGVRSEFISLLKMMDFGIMRYPGGSFVDFAEGFWEYAIGPIDKRRSPNRTYDGTYQRMDFGFPEYMNFCKTMNCEPQITLSYINSSPAIAAQELEYLLGDISTGYGARRAADGHPDPYPVKYFEIGNEEWSDVESYLHDYKEYYSVLKPICDTCVFILSGMHWENKSHFDKTIAVVNDGFDSYSYHPTTGLSPDTKISDSLGFLVMAGHPYNDENYLKRLDSWLKALSPFRSIKQASTEWWSTYGRYEGAEWLLDTNIRNSSMECAIWNAGLQLMYLRNADKMLLANRTIGIGLIKRSINSQGRRTIYSTGAGHAIGILNGHRGDTIVKAAIATETYSASPENTWAVTDIPYLEALITKDRDSIYICMINRYYSDSLVVHIDSLLPDYKEVIHYHISPEKTLDANTAEQPGLLSEKQSIYAYEGKVTLAPHSINVIAYKPANDHSGSPGDKREMTLSPNPSNGLVSIEGIDEEIKYCEIIDIRGGSVTRRIPEGNAIDISVMPYGTYLVKIITGKEIYLRKIVKI